MKELHYTLFLPEHFLDKTVNEQMVADILRETVGLQNLRRGDPREREPDFVSKGAGLEVTFAAFPTPDPQFLHELSDGYYSAEEQQNPNFAPIETALLKKAVKEYRDRPVSLAIFCMAELFSLSDPLLYTEESTKKKEEFFRFIKADYLNRGRFSEIYLIVPTLHASFRIFSVGEGQEYESPVDKESKTRPYYEIDEVIL